ncbi:hypothetical protein, partial [Salmonella enterica]
AQEESVQFILSTASSLPSRSLQGHIRELLMKSGQKLLRSQLSILDPSTHSVTSLIFLDIPYQKVRSRQ